MSSSPAGSPAGYGVSWHDGGVVVHRTDSTWLPGYWYGSDRNPNPAFRFSGPIRISPGRCGRLLTEPATPPVAGDVRPQCVNGSDG